MSELGAVEAAQAAEAAGPAFGDVQDDPSAFGKLAQQAAGTVAQHALGETETQASLAWWLSFIAFVIVLLYVDLFVASVQKSHGSALAQAFALDCGVHDDRSHVLCGVVLLVWNHSC